MIVKILNHFRLTWRLVQDRRVNKWLKVFLVFIPLAYVFLPFPPDDFLPLLGLLDDLLLLTVTTILFVEMCPETVVREHKLALTGLFPSARSINLEDYRCKTEIKAVIGHEMGHILFGHVRIISLMSTQFGLGRLFFYKWSRSCEYSADSVALIASRGDLIPLTSSLLKLAWGLDDSVDIEEFLAQLDGDSGTLSMEVFSTHPFMNNRIKNLIRLAKQADFRKKMEHMDPLDLP